MFVYIKLFDGISIGTHASIKFTNSELEFGIVFVHVHFEIYIKKDYISNNK